MFMLSRVTLEAERGVYGALSVVLFFFSGVLLIHCL